MLAPFITFVVFNIGQVCNSPWTKLADMMYHRRHAANRRRLYNAWRARRGISAARQRVLQILGVDEDGNTAAGPVSRGRLVCVYNRYDVITS